MGSGFFMSIENGLNDVMGASGDTRSRVEVFAEQIPDEWVSTIAALSAKATVRRSRLPSDLVL